jgi:hypothetical protein
MLLPGVLGHQITSVPSCALADQQLFLSNEAWFMSACLHLLCNLFYAQAAALAVLRNLVLFRPSRHCPASSDDDELLFMHGSRCGPASPEWTAGPC